MINLPTRVFDPFRNMTVGFDDIFDRMVYLDHFGQFDATGNFLPVFAEHSVY